MLLHELPILYEGALYSKETEFLEDQVEICASERSPLNRTPDGNSLGGGRLTWFKDLEISGYGHMALC